MFPAALVGSTGSLGPTVPRRIDGSWMIYLLLAQGMNRGGPRTGTDDEDMYDDDDDDDDVPASPLRRTALFAFQVSARRVA